MVAEAVVFRVVTALVGGGLHGGHGSGRLHGGFGSSERFQATREAGAVALVGWGYSKSFLIGWQSTMRFLQQIIIKLAGVLQQPVWNSNTGCNPLLFFSKFIFLLSFGWKRSCV